VPETRWRPRRAGGCRRRARRTSFVPGEVMSPTSANQPPSWSHRLSVPLRFPSIG
jgi:hypothetical protein